MEKQYHISGLDCANCAAKLERKLQEISEFDEVIIDFMAQKLLVSVKDTDALAKGLAKAEEIIKKTEPGVVLSEKKKKVSKTPIHHHEHGEHCGCGHEHSHEEHHHEHGEHCGCGHEHNHEEHHHEHGEHCGCGHEHNHEEHHHEHGEHCSCGHEHNHEEDHHEHGEHCGCGHEHSHEEDHHEHGEHCSCGHEHNHEEHHHEHGEHCGCGHEHSHEEHHHEHGEHCGCGHEHNHEEHHHEHSEHCGCGHDHSHEEHHHEHDAHEHTHAHASGMNFRKRIIKLVLGGSLFAAGAILPSVSFKLCLFFAAYLIVGGDVLLRAAKNISRGQVFDENFLMAIATVGAFAIGEYPEGVAVMLFYQLGELFQDYAVNRSRQSISDLMDIRPDVAYVQRGEQVVAVDPEEVGIGEIIIIKPGEKIPLDGVVLEGTSSLDTQAITGEAVYKTVEQGDAILSGCLNISGLLKVRVEKEFGESTVAQILDLVENASSKKGQTEKFITRFARYYTPIVVIVAALLAVLPPLILQQDFSSWIYRALVFLVISCPCALVISIPLSFFGGLGACSKRGVLIKGSNYLEALAQVETVVFDKTGTLTKGSFKVTGIYPTQGTQEELLEYAAYGEAHSTHPIALALQKAYQGKIDLTRITNVQEIAGFGIEAVIDGKNVLVGNYKLLQQKNITMAEAEVAGTVIYVAVDAVALGYILIKDVIKEDSAEALEKLKRQGVKETVMLTGDSRVAAEEIAQELGLDKVYSELLPGDKVSKLEELYQRQNSGKIAFVGDGINDAPVLARADVGVAMGALGSDAAIEAADVVIMTDEPSRLADAMVIAGKTMTIAKQNIVFTLAVKFAVLLAGVFGMASMWAAVFADVGVAVIAILNAIRILGTKVE